MCGRFAITRIVGLPARFQLASFELDFKPRFNIAPSMEVPIIIRESPNRAVMMKWGLVPFWAKDAKIGNRMINARAETVQTKPAFRTSLKRKRCLVPATGFYEWRRTKDGKIPHFVRMKDESFFAFAGLYDHWKDAEGNKLVTFTIITTEPNALMSKIHNRMPVILQPEDEQVWLENKELASDQLVRLFKPYPARSMESYEVSTAVNNSANDSEDIVRPV